MNHKTFEDELDTIRLEIYEEIKEMTHEEKVAYLRAQTDSIHEKYNIRTVISSG